LERSFTEAERATSLIVRALLNDGLSHTKAEMLSIVRRTISPAFLVRVQRYNALRGRIASARRREHKAHRVYCSGEADIPIEDRLFSGGNILISDVLSSLIYSGQVKKEEAENGDVIYTKVPGRRFRFSEDKRNTENREETQMVETSTKTLKADENREHLLNYQEVADIFRVKRNTVRIWVHRGKLHVSARTPGGEPRISREEVDRLFIAVTRGNA
jgi:excisionase family DNA binding protein